MRILLGGCAMLINMWISVYLLYTYGAPFFPGFPILVTSLSVMGGIIYFVVKDKR